MTTASPAPDAPHPYARLLERVQRPGRYLGAEHGARCRPWADATGGRMVLAFPDTYEVGMSHMGTRILYKVVNDQPDLLLDRAMMPWVDMHDVLLEEGMPLVSLEHARPLADFDVVGVSLQFELTYTTVLHMLDLGGVGLRSAERSEDAPLVVAGGPTATHPEPLAPFVDAFFIGEAEALLPELIRAWIRLRGEGVPRAERLRRLARPFCLYVPALYDTEICPRTGFEVVSAPIAEDGGTDHGGAVPWPVPRALVDDLDEFPFPAGGPEPLAEAVFDRAGIEIARGCTEGCRFCQAGMIYRPVRERSPESILKTLQASVEVGGHDEISLTSLSTADYSAVVPLIDRVAAEIGDDRIALAVSSLRAYGLPEHTMDALRKVRAAGLTFAPEAGTQRMRDVVNKNVSEQDMLDTAHRVFGRGWDRVKLYFMCGLPTETDEDVEATVDVGARVRAVGRRYAGRRAEVTVSVSVHVPKPHTPFQWCAMDTLPEIARKQALLRDQARRHRMKVRTHGAGASLVECVLARGDRRVAEVVELAWRKGCRFDGWDEHFDFERWREAFEEAGLDLERYCETLPVDGRVPWDHIDVGLAEGFLLTEYRRALKGRYSPPCGKPFGGASTLGVDVGADHRTSGGHHADAASADADDRTLVCYDCGVACDMSAMREDRLDFLRDLDALEAHSGSDSTPDEAEISERRSRPRPPPRPDQGPFANLRLRFERVAPAHLVGHRDTIRRLPRILRRAGLRPYYSDGFTPHPIMTYGPALPLGTESLDEAIDVRVRAGDVGDESTLCARLTEASPPGIRFTAAERLAEGARPVSRAIRAVENVVFVYAPAGSTPREREELRAAVEALVTKATGASELPVTVVRKKGEALRDARPSLEEIALDHRAIRAHAWRAANGVPVGAVRTVQIMQPSAPVRPNELLAAMLGSLAGSAELQTVRTRSILEEPKPVAAPAASHS